MTPEQSLNGFLAKFTPAIESVGREALAAMRKQLPGANELVYDNFNALGIGFAATERASDIVMSVVLYPRWVSLFFFAGSSLADSSRRLKGSGNRIRHIVLTNGASTLGEPAVQDLIDQAIARADPPLPQSGHGRIIIKSVSAKQRPRRPPPKAKPKSPSSKRSE